MSEITVLSATPERWDDAQRAMSGGGDGASCSCQWFLLKNSEWEATSSAERRAMLQREITAGPPPGLIGYVDGTAAGWVRVGSRLSQHRLTRGRAAQASPEPANASGVWAVSCFAVRTEFRGIRLTDALLNAAIATAREGGARVVEGYPIDTALAKPSNNALYHGALSTFLRAGFVELSRRSPERVLVSLSLSS